MNNDIGANDANDNGEWRNVGQPERERQELLRLRCEVEQQRLLLQRERLMREIQEIHAQIQAKHESDQVCTYNSPSISDAPLGLANRARWIMPYS